MKYGLSLFFFCLLNFFANAQQLKIHTTPPKVIKVGESYTLKVKVEHHFKEEFTGNITMSLLNHATKNSVDGWFLNIFPFQYFTTILNTPFEAEFPFTVPDAYIGKFDLVLNAQVNHIKDSVQFVVHPTKK